MPVNEATTFPKLLLELARRYGNDRVALQEKRYGIWQPITWFQYAARVRDFAHGLAALGVEPGQVVAILGDNRPEWLIAELAAQSLGGCSVGIYPTSVGEEIVHILNHGRVRVVVAEDQEQVDKIIALWERLETVEHVIFYDPHGLEQYQRKTLVDFTEIEARGRGYERELTGKRQRCRRHLHHIRHDREAEVGHADARKPSLDGWSPSGGGSHRDRRPLREFPAARVDR